VSEQLSPEWFSARLGKVTASRVADVIAKTKTGWGAARANYAAQLIAERLTGVVQESYTNSAMQWGVDTEEEARTAYEFRTDATVIPAWFMEHPTIAMSGASPDGLIDDDGLLELKCPNTATHLETLLGGSLPAKYVTQMQWQMACSGRSWCDFASYDPRMPEAMRLFVKRVRRDEKMIGELEAAVVEFLSELDAKMAGLSHLYGSGPSPAKAALEASVAAA
jgi:putative phage-type endonuclease